MIKRSKKLICIALCLLIAFSGFGNLNIKTKALTQSQLDYMAEIGAAASEDMQVSGILASLTLAQSILEAGWGTSTMAKVAKNIFGIKAHASWKGMVYDGYSGIVYNSYADYAAANTDEYIAANVQRIWRAYATWYESLADHSALLTAAARYDNIPFEYDYVAAAWNIIEDGYATDMEYTKKLINCIEVYNLTKYDVMNYPADEVVITSKTRKYLPINEQWQLPVTVIQPFGAEDALTYSSNDTTVATVDETGMVTAVGYGECLITVTSSTGWHANCYIATYDPEIKYYECICVDDINVYASPSEESEKYGYLPSRHCIVAIGDPFEAEDGNMWRQVYSKVYITNGVIRKTGYIRAEGATREIQIIYTDLTDTASITLDTEAITVAQYQKSTVKATPLNENGRSPSCPTVRWVSDNPAVATVNAGVITGVSEGECTIYAVSPDGVYTSCKVTVTPGVFVPAESVELSSAELALTINDTHTLTATVMPEDATDKTVTWSTSNAAVATVDQGKIIAIGEGEAIITATCGEKSAQCKITVSKPVFTGKIYDGAVHGTKVNLRQGPDTSYPSLGRVNQGDTLIIYGDHSNNWYNVKVTSGDSAGLEGYIYFDYVRIHNEQVESLVITTPDTTLTAEDTLKLEWTVNPLNSTVTFESSDTNVATVNEEGLITAVSEGTATITAKAGKLTASITVTVKLDAFAGTKYLAQVSTNGGVLYLREGAGTQYNILGKFAYLAEITVYGEAVDGWYAASGTLMDGTEANGYVSAQWITVISRYATAFELTEKQATLIEGETYTIIWTVSPEEIIPKFTVADAAIASVDENGVVTAKKAGTTVITASAGGKKQEFTLTVEPKPEPELPKNLIPKAGIFVTDGYIHGIKANTTKEELVLMFENESKYIEIQLSGSEYAGTGTVVSLKDKNGNVVDTATVIVLGDCDGSGTVSATDYLIVRRIVLLTYEYTDIQYEAARVAGLPAVSATDYLMVRRHFLGLYDIYTQSSLN